MAAGAWTVYNRSKRKIGAAALSLASTVFRLSLYLSTSNAATLTLSTKSQVTNEVAEAGGYSSSGKSMTNELWTAGTSAGQIKFDADDVFWSANGASISGIKFALIWISGASAAARHVLCFSQLSTARFSISTGNRLTIQMNASGILTLA
jgi:hypothetical protein